MSESESSKPLCPPPVHPSTPIHILPQLIPLRAAEIAVFRSKPHLSSLSDAIAVFPRSFEKPSRSSPISPLLFHAAVACLEVTHGVIARLWWLFPFRLASAGACITK